MSVGTVNDKKMECCKDEKMDSIFDGCVSNSEVLSSNPDQVDFLSTFEAIIKNTELLAHSMEELLKESEECERLISRLNVSRIAPSSQGLE